MGELEDKLNGILSNPKEMEKLVGMAKKLSGAFGGGAEPEGGTTSAASEPTGFEGLDPKLMGLITKAIGEYGRGDDKSALLSALKPYLREERRSAVDRAAQIAKLARIARLAIGEFSGGENDV